MTLSRTWLGVRGARELFFWCVGIASKYLGSFPSLAIQWLENETLSGFWCDILGAFLLVWYLEGFLIQKSCFASGYNYLDVENTFIFSLDRCRVRVVSSLKIWQFKRVWIRIVQTHVSYLMSNGFKFFFLFKKYKKKFSTVKTLFFSLT